MSFTFTKLFSSITESTIWVESDRTRLVWITMLAMADRQGRVWASIPGLANRARVPVEDCRAAIDLFLAPDADSRTPAHEGRRIEPIDGGWKLLNYKKYREIRDEEAAKESKRNYINARRARERAKKQDVEKVEHGRTKSTEAEAEAEAEADHGKATPSFAEPGSAPAGGTAELPLGTIATNPVNDPIAMTFPTAGRLKEWPLRESKITEWTASYPGVDVAAACRELRQWCIDNVTKRKTARGMAAFLSRCLERRQNKSPISHATHKPSNSRSFANRNDYSGVTDK